MKFKDYEMLYQDLDLETLRLAKEPNNDEQLSAKTRQSLDVSNHLCDALINEGMDDLISQFNEGFICHYELVKQLEQMLIQLRQ